MKKESRFRNKTFSSIIPENSTSNNLLSYDVIIITESGNKSKKNHVSQDVNTCMHNTYGLKIRYFFCDSSIPAQTWKSHSDTHISTGTYCVSAKTDKKGNIKYKDANNRDCRCFFRHRDRIRGRLQQKLALFEICR